MMQELIATLQGISEQDFLWSVAVLIFFTCLGFLPNNNDLVLIAATLIAKMKLIPLYSILAVIIASWILGETTMFFVGRVVGRKVLQWKVIQNKINPDTWNKIQNLVNTRPLPLFLVLRITPIFRSYLMVIVGSVGMQPKSLLKYHPWILMVYATLVGSLFYSLGDILQNFVGDNQLPITLTVIAVWMTALFLIGRSFYRKIFNYG